MDKRIKVTQKVKKFLQKKVKSCVRECQTVDSLQFQKLGSKKRVCSKLDIQIHSSSFLSSSFLLDSKGFRQIKRQALLHQQGTFPFESIMDQDNEISISMMKGLVLIPSNVQIFISQILKLFQDWKKHLVQELLALFTFKFWAIEFH